jgi:hypothetical protein
MPAKLMLLAIGLGVGGTESHILDLASGIDRSRFDVSVCTLKSGGRIAEELRARGIKVFSVNGTGKLDARVLFRLLKIIRDERPDVILGECRRKNLWAYPANVFNRLVIPR